MLAKLRILFAKSWVSWLFAVQQITWMFLGLLLAHVAANSHLYLSRGKCVSWVFANDILCIAKSVNLCGIQYSLFITFVHLSKKCHDAPPFWNNFMAGDCTLNEPWPVIPHLPFFGRKEGERKAVNSWVWMHCHHSHKNNSDLFLKTESFLEMTL